MAGLIGKLRSRLRKAIGKQWRAISRSFDINLFSLVFIEPCYNLCNLRCPYCPVGQGLTLRNMPKGMMSLDLFQRIWAKSFTTYRGQVSLYNWGEPFLNPALPAMVRHVKEHSSARLILNSNFSLSLDDRLREILKYLDNDTIIISCDGFSQATCEKYRVNVDFDLVMHNIELINSEKKPQTELVWQYLTFPWNLDEVKAAEEFCKRKQIMFQLGEGGATPNYPMLPTPRTSNRDQSRCDFFYRALMINFDGEVYPCCTYFGPKQYSLGNASEKSIKKIFSEGKGKEMLEYLTFKSSGNDGLFCKHCVERNAGELESWK